MPTYMVLSNFTEEGIHNVQDTLERLKRFKEIAQGENAKVITHHYLMGDYDMVTMLDAPNMETVAKLCLLVGKKGFLRTHTFQAITETEMAKLTNGLK